MVAWQSSSSQKLTAQQFHHAPGEIRQPDGHGGTVPLAHLSQFDQIEYPNLLIF